jgi:hypothetical protein
MVELCGGPTAAGIAWNSADEKVIERARRSGTVDLYVGDRLAALLGFSAVELWGDAFYAPHAPMAPPRGRSAT